MRIIAGTHRGQRLRSPRGLQVRPTSDRVKEALFNILGPRIEGTVVLDLFSGTGNLALEALSRGAERAVCVDASASSVRVIRQNIALLRLKDRAEVMQLPADRALATLQGRGESFDIVFLDPPYGRNLISGALRGLCDHELLLADGLIVAEHHRGEEVGATPGLTVKQRRTYGDTALTFLAHDIP